MSVLLAIPLLTGLVLVQSAVFSRISLLRGTTDLLLLVVLAWALHKRVDTAWHWSVIAGLLIGIVSALPFGTALVGYLLATGVALLLRQRIWQAPILAMFVATFVGTLITQAVSLFVLRAAGAELPWLRAVNLVTLPSLLLNLLLAIPAFGLVTDLANWMYPEELEV